MKSVSPHLLIFLYRKRHSDRPSQCKSPSVTFPWKLTVLIVLCKSSVLTWIGVTLVIYHLLTRHRSLNIDIREIIGSIARLKQLKTNPDLSISSLNSGLVLLSRDWRPKWWWCCENNTTDVSAFCNFHFTLHSSFTHYCMSIVFCSALLPLDAPFSANLGPANLLCEDGHIAL